jgi:CheY-like chemotaxis protein
LNPGSIAPIFKRVAQWIGMPERIVDRVSGHSTRVGATQDLAALDIDLAAITQAGGWKSTRMPLQYAEKINTARSGMHHAVADTVTFNFTTGDDSLIMARLERSAGVCESISGRTSDERACGRARHYTHFACVHISRVSSHSAMSACMILLIEDHVALGRALVRSLTALGYEIRLALTADEALILLKEGLLPHLVLTDIRTVGEHNGLDLAWWVKANRPTIPVLLQTAFAQEDTADFPILHKPYSIEALSAAVDGLLKATETVCCFGVK